MIKFQISCLFLHLTNSKWFKNKSAAFCLFWGSPKINFWRPTTDTRASSQVSYMVFEKCSTPLQRDSNDTKNVKRFRKSNFLSQNCIFLSQNLIFLPQKNIFCPKISCFFLKKYVFVYFFPKSPESLFFYILYFPM